MEYSGLSLENALSRHAEIFRKLVSISGNQSNLNQRRRMWETLGPILNELENGRVHFYRERNSLIAKGRSDYLSMIRDRGTHHKTKAERFANNVLGLHGTIYPLNRYGNEHRLRDYYHEAYYAVFFAARYGMVNNGHFDSLIHKNLPDDLRDFSRLNSSLSPKLTQTSSTLVTLKEYRTTADYVLGRVSLGTLSQVAIISDVLSQMQTTFHNWGI